MKEKLSRLEKIDWEFSDYRGFHSFPADINSLHWYPAPFVPHIPAILIQALTERGDIVLDPYAGVGVALIEAAKLKRKPVGLDINPFAVDIMNAKFHALSLADKRWLSSVREDLEFLPVIDAVDKYSMEFGIDKEVFKWFERETLKELCSLHRYVLSESDSKNRSLKKVTLSSIFQRCCSQRDHYTYVTDRCYPKQLHYVNAKKMFLEQTKLITAAAETFRKQYEIMYDEKWIDMDGIITIGDARSLEFLKNDSIDIVITSPPYLGVNDYVRSMRLTWLFFPEKNIKKAMENEIGARRKRNRKHAYDGYIDNMDKSFSEISRVLKSPGFFCLVVGQGRGKVNKRNVVEELLRILRDVYDFKIEMRVRRKIKFRRIQVSGVGNEEIIILNRDLVVKQNAT
jgi:DNA modification methylase